MSSETEEITVQLLIPYKEKEVHQRKITKPILMYKNAIVWRVILIKIHFIK